MDITTFEINHPFPLPGPQREGAHLELWRDGLTLIIQFPMLTPAELRAFQIGFRRYSYLEAGDDVPVAVFVFDFPKPFGLLDANFNALAVREPKNVSNYLTPEDGQPKNGLTIFLVDGQTLKATKLVGLLPRSVMLFQDTIRKQFARNYQKFEYDRALREIYQYPSAQLFKQGVTFQMRKK